MIVKSSEEMGNIRELVVIAVTDLARPRLQNYFRHWLDRHIA